MKIRYSVGSRAGRITEVDEVTGRWMIDKRRAVEVAPEPAPEAGGEAPRTKRKYTRKAPVAPVPGPDVEDAQEQGTEDEGSED